MKFPLVISLGGSVIVPKDVAVGFLQRFRSLVLRVSKQRTVIIVTGGGGVNRHYVSAATKLARVPAADLDWIGIAATRLNAELVRSLFGAAAFERVLLRPTEKVVTRKRIFVGCGWVPGHSSDTAAVLLAKTYGAKEIVNISNIPYVFNRDPKERSDAKPFRSLTWRQYRRLIARTWSPRLSTPFDPIASKLAEKFGMTVFVVAGKSLAPFQSLLTGQSFLGTTIHP